MKIAIACFNLNWQSGGPRLIFSSAQALKKFGHEVVIYAPEWSGEYFEELWRGLDIRVVPSSDSHVLSEKPKGILDWARKRIQVEKLRKKTAEKIALAIGAGFDALNVHDTAYEVAYFYKKQNKGAKIVWTENDPPFSYLPKRGFIKNTLSKFYNAWKEFESRKYFRAIDAAAVLDSYNKNWCEERGIKAVITRLGVDPKFYLPVKDLSAKFKEKKVRVFGLGSLNQYRHYEDTILAVKRLRDDGYDASALIIAGDMWDEKAYREKVQRLIRESGTENHIDFRLKGVSEEELREAYGESDVFVYAMYNPPPRNGFGFSIGVFEAMAAGLPVILCNTTTSAEVLEDGESALFVDPMSPEQIAEKVKLLVDDPAFYKNIALAGQKIVKEELAWDRYVEKFLKIVLQ